MNIFQLIILGIVEGITEFLPISSTGHLILTTDILKIPQTEFVKSFIVIIQTGAILAVVFLYWRILINHKKIVSRIIAAFLPTAIIGFVLYKFIKGFLLGNEAVTLWALFLGGIILILLEMYFKYISKPLNSKTSLEKNPSSISYKQAVLIGVFQSLSVIPGVSRALSTIFGGIIVGLGRKEAVEFSFLLAVPTMIAATTLDLTETSINFTIHEWLMLLLGLFVSFIVAMLIMKWFIKYITNHTFLIFGIYRIVLALLFYLVFLK